jgi:phytoene dehydrogenase-like protein
MPTRYDAVVGVGHNGLTCACYLAKAGLKVLGSGSHPGPGVSMAPGRNAAETICADLGLDFASTVATKASRP